MTPTLPLSSPERPLHPGSRRGRSPGPAAPSCGPFLAPPVLAQPVRHPTVCRLARRASACPCLSLPVPQPARASARRCHATKVAVLPAPRHPRGVSDSSHIFVPGAESLASGCRFSLAMPSRSHARRAARAKRQHRDAALEVHHRKRDLRSRDNAEHPIRAGELMPVCEKALPATRGVASNHVSYVPVLVRVDFTSGQTLIQDLSGVGGRSVVLVGWTVPPGYEVPDGPDEQTSEGDHDERSERPSPPVHAAARIPHHRKSPLRRPHASMVRLS